jgi:nucleoside-diphosphate-sugar epimerase
MALYLVTGGAGFIGSHITAALLARGDRVRVFDDLSSGRLENLTGLDVDFVQGDITDAALCMKACRGVDGVFHEAAQVSVPKSVEEPERSYEVNVMGTLRLLEACRQQGVGRLVFAASSAAYGDSETLPKVETMPTSPLSPYASGKVGAEHLLQVYGHLFGIKTVALRYFNIFGPRQLDDSPYTGVIAIFARALLDGGGDRTACAPKIFGDGEQTRDFTYVDNAVQANLKAMGADLEPGTVVNVGGGERISVNELYSAMAAELGVDLAAHYEPARAGDVRHSLASLDRARELLGYEPTVSWREGLSRTVSWYRDRAASVGA